MEKATVSKLKDNLSAYLRKVRAGRVVVVYDRDVPIARIERIESSGSDDERLALLEAQGLVKPPRQRLDVERISRMVKARASAVSLLDALLEERESSDR